VSKHTERQMTAWKHSLPAEAQVLEHLCWIRNTGPYERSASISDSSGLWTI